MNYINKINNLKKSIQDIILEIEKDTKKAERLNLSIDLDQLYLEVIQLQQNEQQHERRSHLKSILSKSGAVCQITRDINYFNRMYQLIKDTDQNLIYNYFLDPTGSYEVNPLEYYGNRFVNSQLSDYILEHF